MLPSTVSSCQSSQRGPPRPAGRGQMWIRQCRVRVRAGKRMREQISRMLLKKAPEHPSYTVLKHAGTKASHNVHGYWYCYIREYVYITWLDMSPFSPSFPSRGNIRTTQRGRQHIASHAGSLVALGEPQLKCMHRRSDAGILITPSGHGHPPHTIRRWLSRYCWLRGGR